MIDLGQAVSRDQPDAAEFLRLDCEHVTHFFQQEGMPRVADPKQLAALVITSISKQEEEKQLQGSENADSPVAKMAAYARGLGRWAASPAIAARLAALLRSDLSPALALDGHEPATTAAVTVAAPASTAAAASSVDVEPAAAAAAAVTTASTS